MRKTYDWSKFYPAKFRLICIEDEYGVSWVFQKRKFIFFWAEHARCHKYDTSQILLTSYRQLYEKRGYL